MRYASASAFRTALEARLSREQTDGVGISRLRKRVVFERLLARLQAVAPGGWVLTGGFALELRLGGHARTTKDKDIDIDWTLEEDAATELLLDAAAHEMDDLFTFDVKRVHNDDDLAGGGQRWVVRAELAGREFERVAIDVGFGKPPVVAPDTIDSSHLLEFAGIPPVAVPERSAFAEEGESDPGLLENTVGQHGESVLVDLPQGKFFKQTTQSADDLDLLLISEALGFAALWNNLP